MNKLDAAQFEQLQKLDSPTVANAVETFGVRLRNTGFTDSRVRCMFTDFPPMAGYAVTARVRTSETPMEGHSYYDRTDWWDYILTIPAPRIIVLEDADRSPGLGAFIEEIHASIFRALGCIGAVTNGAVRGVPAARAMGFHMFAGNLSVSHAYAHVFEFGSAVVVGGMKVEPGDLLHGDVHGVQTVPLEIAGRVPEVAEQFLADKQRIVAVCRSSGATIDNIRAVVKDRKT